MRIYRIFIQILIMVSVVGVALAQKSESSAKTTTVLNKTLVLYKDKSITARQEEVFKLIEPELLKKENRDKSEALSYYSQFEFKFLSEASDKLALNKLLLIQMTALDASMFASTNRAEQNEGFSLSLAVLEKKNSQFSKLQITQDEIDQNIGLILTAMDYLKFRLSTMQTSGAADFKEARERNLKIFYENLKKKNKVKFL